MKVAFISLGCDKNLVDSEIMLGLTDECGYEITSDEEAADVIIINTCGFISEAAKEGVDEILRLTQYKEGNCKALIATGCMVQRYKDEMLKEFPEIDALVGVGDFERIGEIIQDALAGKKICLVTDNNKRLVEENSHKRMLSTAGYFAYLKIAEGCDNFCTYCTIPSIRGAYRSRTIESLVKEAEILSDKGVKELVIVAQDTTLYGSDIYGAPKLPELLNKLAAVDGIEWIRIMYAYPENVTDEIISCMASSEKICNYLDMPIQHAHDGVLKRMGRRSSTDKIRQVVSKLRAAMPDIALRTTLICGFPGETDQEFDFLLSFIKEIKFDKLGVFEYSKEDGTPAAKLKGQVLKKVKKIRKNILMNVQKDIAKEKGAEHIGRELKVIVEGKLSDEDVYMGRSYMDAYDVDGLVFFEYSGQLLSGDFVNVRINESSDYDLLGGVMDESCQ